MSTLNEATKSNAPSQKKDAKSNDVLAKVAELAGSHAELSASSLNVTHSQLEEALEERVSTERRVKSRPRPDAIVERRVNQRRK